MRRAEIAKRKPDGTDQQQPRDGDGAEAAAKQKIPYWYMSVYRSEGPGHTSWSRRDHLESTALQQQIPYRKARKEYLAWKRKQHQEDIAALWNQVHADPTPALAAFRNLRRLTIFTRLHFIVAPKHEDDIHARTHETVRNWLNGLLSTKQGAEFEAVTFYVVSHILSESVDVKTEFEELAFKYVGGRDADGAAEINEDVWWSSIG